MKRMKLKAAGGPDVESLVIVKRRRAKGLKVDNQPDVVSLVIRKA